MFFEGWGSPGGANIGPKIDVDVCMAPFSDNLDFCSSIVGQKRAFLEKGRVRAEQFLRPGARQGDLS